MFYVYIIIEALYSPFNCNCFRADLFVNQEFVKPANNFNFHWLVNSTAKVY